MATEAADKQAVLIVDDDDAVRDLVATVLADEGYAVRTAATGHEALAVARDERPAVVVMDVNMPGLDGLTACQLMRADERLAGLPVLIVSARPVDRDQLRASRADRFLPKPFDLTELVGEVGRFLDQRAVA